MNIFEYFDWEWNTYGPAKEQMPDWRLGQAFYVQFEKDGREFADLFYETDPEKARKLIFEYYDIG